MSVEAQAWAFQVPLKPCPKAVLNALANRADEEGYCWPGLGDLERRTGWKRRAIQNALRELEGLKILTTSARYSSNGHQISNMYRLSMPAVVLGAPDARGGAPDARGGAPDARGGAPDARGGAPDAPKSSKESSKELTSNQEPPLTPLEGGRVEVMDVGEVSFERFWGAYPRKVGKKAAWASWKKARDKPSLEQILQAVQRAMRSRKWRDGYIPNPVTWLNQGRWGDDQSEGDVSKLSPAKACVPVAPRQAQGEACPPEVAAKLSRLFGKKFSFTADGQQGAA